MSDGEARPARTKEDESVPLAFRVKNWRGTYKLPKGSRKKPVKLEQCTAMAGKVRCHGHLGHVADQTHTRHYAQGVLADGWTHRWEWDDRGRITKDRWIQEAMF